MNISKYLKAAAVVAVAVSLVALPVSAQASNPDAKAAAKTVTYATLPLPNNVVGAGQLSANSVGLDDMGVQVKKFINDSSARSTEALNKAEDALTRPDFGTSSEPISFAPKTITNLGGKYFGDTTNTADDRFTTIGSFSLPKGTWLVNTVVTFHRDTAGVVGSRPQVGLRIGQDQTLSGDEKWGKPVGTVGGADISPAKGHDLFGSTVATVIASAATTVGVYGFGYNDDQGSAGSGELTASVTVTAVRVG